MQSISECQRSMGESESEKSMSESDASRGSAGGTVVGDCERSTSAGDAGVIVNRISIAL